jgi:hypothetical protein
MSIGLLINLDNLERIAIRKKEEIKLRKYLVDCAEHTYGNLNKDTPFTDTKILQYILKYTASLYPIYSILDIYLIGGRTRRYYEDKLHYEIVVVTRDEITDKELVNISNQLAKDNFLRGKLTTKDSEDVTFEPKLILTSIKQSDFLKRYEAINHHSNKNDDVYKARRYGVRLALCGIYDINS